jgi:preprotein translocase subunit YajC
MLAAIAQETTPSNPLITFAPLLLMGAVFYFLLIRPQKKRARAQQELVNSVQVGDDVMTTGGIFGTISQIDDDEGTIELEIAPGTRIRMVRAGVARRLTEEDDDYEDESEDEDQSSS